MLAQYEEERGVGLSVPSRAITDFSFILFHLFKVHFFDKALWVIMGKLIHG